MRTSFGEIPHLFLMKCFGVTSLECEMSFSDHRRRQGRRCRAARMLISKRRHLPRDHFLRAANRSSAVSGSSVGPKPGQSCSLKVRGTGEGRHTGTSVKETSKCAQLVFVSAFSNCTLRLADHRSRPANCQRAVIPQSQV